MATQKAFAASLNTARADGSGVVLLPYGSSEPTREQRRQARKAGIAHVAVDRRPAPAGAGQWLRRTTAASGPLVRWF